MVFDNKNETKDMYVSTVHNDNLQKIATSVSLLFESEENNIDLFDSKLDELVFEELPSIEKLDNFDDIIYEEETSEKVIDKGESSLLVSIDASKYKSDDSMGFVVTENNKQYELDDYEFNVVVAVVAGEFDKVIDDALGVVSVILNRCDSSEWVDWAGNSPYQQVIKAGQFEVYFKDYYLSYMPGGKYYGTDKYNIAKQAVIDGLNGIRNNKYLGFRAWYVSSYSNNYIVTGGNRYGFN